MYTIIGTTESGDKHYGSFASESIAEKQLELAKEYIDYYNKNKHKQMLRVINSILGESDLHHELCSDYRIENTH